MSFTQADVVAAFDHFEGNWGELKQSENAACTFCLAEFRPETINALYRFEEGIAYDQLLSGASSSDTARCPNCGLPYVIGDGAGLPVSDPGYVAAVRKHWHETPAHNADTNGAAK